MEVITDFLSQRSVVSVLQADHAYLRYLLVLVRDETYPVSHRKKIFTVLVMAVKSHFEAEKMAIYERVSHGDPQLVRAVFEGEEEHRIIMELLARIENERNLERWMAELTVFGDLLLSHMREEEVELFPAIQRKYDMDGQRGMIDIYTRETRAASESGLEVYRVPGLGEVSSELPSSERTLENYRPAIVQRVQSEIRSTLGF